MKHQFIVKFYVYTSIDTVGAMTAKGLIMFDILELKKIFEEDEKITFTFEISKDMLPGFMVLFNGISELTEDLSKKIREAQCRRLARFEAYQQTLRADHERIKEAIRRSYLEHLDRLKSIKEAFKITRKEYIPYTWLVRQVRQEFRAKRELEIFRLYNLGTEPKTIAKKLYMSTGAVRKVIGGWKYHRPAPKKLSSEVQKECFIYSQY